MRRCSLCLLALVALIALSHTSAQYDDYSDGMDDMDYYNYDDYYGDYADDYKYDDYYLGDYAGAQFNKTKNPTTTPTGKTPGDTATPATTPAGKPLKPGKKSQPIGFAPEAELINGIDDIDPAGNCTAEIKQYCDKVEPGEARLADCLQEQVEAEETDGNSGDQVTISKKCKMEILDFKVLRDTNINLNTNLAKMCKADADKYCNVTWFFGYKSGQVVACLRDRKEKLAGPCKKEVFKIQLDAALDYRADVVLFEACHADADQLCNDVEAGGGRIQACLRDKRLKLSWHCEEELFRQEMEDADDIRLSVRLFRKCLKDKKKFCPDIAPGNAAAKECLEEHREEEGFTQGCRDELDNMIARRVRDFRLDSRLQKVCEKDILNMCAWFEHLDSMDDDDAGVVRCLQDYVREISNPACKKRVRRYKRLAAQDIRFNVPLADNCFEDRQKYCSNVPPGSARVIRCLESNREKLSLNCRATLFDEEQKFSENIDFQYPMKQACLKEIDRFCKDVPHGNGRVIRCLQDNKTKKEFGKGCKEEVVKYEKSATGDYRLNFRLRTACQNEVKLLCKDACKVQEGQICAGRVLRCLTEKKDEIKNKECIKEVTYFQKMEVSDYRNDVILAEACRADVQAHCANVEPGEGRIHQCLRKNRGKLSPGCRKEELLLEQQENDSVELKVSLLKSCSNERALYCKDVEPGSGRVFRCLAENMRDADFGQGCRDEVLTKLRRRQTNWRLDPALRKACRTDVPVHCAAEDAGQTEDAAVYKCLISRASDISPSCAKELGRAVHMAFFVWEEKGLITAPCDEDIKAFCLTDRPNMGNTPGAVGTCLAEILEQNYQFLDPHNNRRRLATLPDPKKSKSGYVVVRQLSDQCRQLAEVAEPPNMRQAFEASLTVALLHNQLASMEDATGLQMMNRDKRGNAQSLTLTGWTAIAGMGALLIVVVYGAVVLYRKYYGLDKFDYTLVVKKDVGKKGGK